jgi:hypothetical protein
MEQTRWRVAIQADQRTTSLATGYTQGDYIATEYCDQNGQTAESILSGCNLGDVNEPQGPLLPTQE